MVQGSRFKVQGSRFKVQGSRVKVQGFKGQWLEFVLKDYRLFSLHKVKKKKQPAKHLF